MTRLRVGVNLLWLVPGAVGGTEEYATRLLGALAEYGEDDELDVTLFVLPSLAEAHPGLTDRFRTVVAPVHGHRRPTRVAAETTWLALEGRRRRLDLVHHLGGTVPLVRGRPAVVTIHDLQPLVHPEHFGFLKRTWLRAMLPWSARAARTVVAISATTADAVVERLGVERARLRVVPHGYDPPAVLPSARDVDRVQATYRLGRRWFVYPAVTWPHKNHVLLVRAFATVAATEEDISLVLTGAAGPAEDAVAAEVAALGLEDRVARTGRIGRDELDALIAGSVAVPLPSAFEGFGAPALEAMGLGAPVVAARAGSLPEVVGDAAILLDPTAPDDWSATMIDLLHDEPQRQRLIVAGRARVATKGWAASVEALRSVWREAGEVHP